MWKTSEGGKGGTLQLNYDLKEREIDWFTKFQASQNNKVRLEKIF